MEALYILSTPTTIPPSSIHIKNWAQTSLLNENSIIHSKSTVIPPLEVDATVLLILGHPACYSNEKSCPWLTFQETCPPLWKFPWAQTQTNNMVLSFIHWLIPSPNIRYSGTHHLPDSYHVSNCSWPQLPLQNHNIIKPTHPLLLPPQFLPTRQIPSHLVPITQIHTIL